MSDEISSLYQVEVIPTARREAANAAAARAGAQRRFAGWCGNRVRTRQSASGGAPPCGLRLAPPDGGCKAKNVCASPRKAACSGAAFYPRRHGQPPLRWGRPAGARSRKPATPPHALLFSLSSAQKDEKSKGRDERCGGSALAFPALPCLSVVSSPFWRVGAL